MALGKKEKLRLEMFAEEIRLTTMRAVASYGEGHIGGALSMAELMAALYGHFLRVDPHQPQMPERDKLVLSKGHCGPVLYATLALKGFFPMEKLMEMNRFGTMLPSHCDRLRTPGVDMSTGSLGQGSSSAAGIALADRLKGLSSRTFLILGDGECEEGQVWEMVMFAAQQKLDTLVTFVDRNRQQLDGYTDDICKIGDLETIFRAYGWHSVTVDGHDIEAICHAVEETDQVKGRPSAIILNTVKGKGWDEAEKCVPCHYMKVSHQQLSDYEQVSAERTAALQAALGECDEKAVK